MQKLVVMPNGVQEEVFGITNRCLTILHLKDRDQGPKRIRPETESNHISAFCDVLPTLCEIAGLDIPDDTDGISFLPTLPDYKQTAHKHLYWEFRSYGGQQAVRLRKWKAIRKIF